MRCWILYKEAHLAKSPRSCDSIGVASKRVPQAMSHRGCDIMAEGCVRGKGRMVRYET
jgi:hypothetical protein